MEADIHWKAEEYAHREKTVDWYWALGIISVSAIIISIILKNFLFAILILIGAGTVVLFSVKKPRLIDVKINHKGIIIDKFFHPYSEIDSFWIDGHRLMFRSRKTLHPLITVPAPMEEFEQDLVREYLLEYLEESEESTSSFVDVIVNKLGF